MSDRTSDGQLAVVPRSPGRRHRIVAGAVLTGLLMGVGGTALADDPDGRKKQIDGQIAQSREDLDTVSSDLRTALNNLNITNGKVAKARTDLGRADKALRDANKHNNDIAGKLRVAQADETKNSKALTKNTADQGRTKVLVGGLARRSYMQGGLGRLELTLNVLTAGKGDVTNSLSMADIVMRQQGGVFQKLSGQQSAGKATGNRLGSIRRQIADLKVKAQAGVTRAKKARDDKAKAKTALDGLQVTQKNAADNLQKKKNKELSDLKWLQGESTRLQKILDGRAKARAKARADARRKAAAENKPDPVPVQGPRSSDGHFLTGPRPKSQIASPFGYRMHPILHIRLLHAGSDFSFGCGAPVYAAAAGDVVNAGFNSIAGNNVVIDHGYVGGSDLATQYEHLSRFAVRGGSVKKGQVIGYVGSTGRSTGCHLHFAVMANGRYVNPTNWIG